MPVEAHQCPSCGAPLQVADQKVATVCIYCNSALVVTRDAAGHGELTKDADVDEETVERIKGMLLAGEREQAIALFQEKTSRARDVAVDAIDEYAAHIVQKAAFSGTLNSFGLMLLLTGMAIAGGSIYLAITSPSMALLAIVGMLIGGVQMYMLGGPGLRTLRYLGATVGEARVLRHAYIGRMRHIHSYRVLVEVTGPDGEAFQTEYPFPVGETGRAKMRDGLIFQVKYFPGRPDSVVFHGHLEP